MRQRLIDYRKHDGFKYLHAFLYTLERMLESDESAQLRGFVLFNDLHDFGRNNINKSTDGTFIKMVQVCNASLCLSAPVHMLMLAGHAAYARWKHYHPEKQHARSNYLCRDQAFHLGAHSQARTSLSPLPLPSFSC